MWQSVLMRAIPIPIRKRILELYEGGKSTREISQFSGFCVAAVRRVWIPGHGDGYSEIIVMGIPI